jgi:hypothetical protein
MLTGERTGAKTNKDGTTRQDAGPLEPIPELKHLTGLTTPNPQTLQLFMEGVNDRRLSAGSLDLHTNTRRGCLQPIVPALTCLPTSPLLFNSDLSDPGPDPERRPHQRRDRRG